MTVAFIFLAASRAVKLEMAVRDLREPGTYITIAAPNPGQEMHSRDLRQRSVRPAHRLAKKYPIAVYSMRTYNSGVKRIF